LQDGSIVVFQLPHGCEEEARDLCARFAAEPSAESAICIMAGWGRSFDGIE